MFAGFGHTIPRATLLVCYVAHGSYKRECPRSANAAQGVVGEGLNRVQQTCGLRVLL